MKKALILLVVAGMLLSIGAAAPKNPAASKKAKPPKPTTEKAKADEAGEKIADFAESFCKTAMTKQKEIVRFFNMEFLLRAAGTDADIAEIEAQAKSAGKSIRKLIEEKTEQDFNDESPAITCKITDAQETPCEGMYQMMNEGGSLPEGITQDRMKQVGKKMEIKKCGSVEFMADQDTKSNTLFTAQIEGKWSIINMKKPSE
ncbi:MAG: hypothetical protein WCX65_09770 [bacterium]